MRIQQIMAHTLNVPMAFEFTPYAVSWCTGAIEVLGSAAKLRKGTSTGIGVSRGDLIVAAHVNREQRVRSKGMRAGESFPAQVSGKSLPVNMPSAAVQSGAESRGQQLEILVCTSPLIERGKVRDPWRMRDEFLRLKRAPNTLFAFVKKWGLWDMSPLQQVDLSGSAQGSGRDGSILDGFDVVPYFVVVAKVWELQNFYLEALKGPPEKWLAYADGLRSVAQGRRAHPSVVSEWLNRPEALLRRAVTRQEYPHFFLREILCRDAIEATITIDFLRRIKFRPCKRPDCSGVFEVESRHKRKFCSQYCGHLESVRKQRREQSKQKKQAAAARKSPSDGNKTPEEDRQHGEEGKRNQRTRVRRPEFAGTSPHIKDAKGRIGVMSSPLIGNTDSPTL